MEYLIKVLKILYVPNTECLEPFRYGLAGTYQNEQWKSNVFDRGNGNEILNYQDNSQYSAFQKYKTANELWEALEKEYSIEDRGTKTYAIDNFLDFQKEGKLVIV